MTGSVNSNTEDRYAPTTWGEPDREFTVSSGQRCRIKNIDLRDVISAGLVDRLNTLTGVVDKSVRKGKGKPPAVDPAKLVLDKRTGLQFADLVDEMVCMVVTAPVVHPLPPEGEERVAGQVYVDGINLVDKIDIFNASLGGLRDLEKFHDGHEEPA